ncbi:unnamed protein product, partial [Amoebophrya sp. A120]
QSSGPAPARTTPGAPPRQDATSTSTSASAKKNRQGEGVASTTSVVLGAGKKAGFPRFQPVTTGGAESSGGRKAAGQPLLGDEDNFEIFEDPTAGAVGTCAEKTGINKASVDQHQPPSISEKGLEQLPSATPGGTTAAAGTSSSFRWMKPGSMVDEKQVLKTRDTKNVSSQANHAGTLNHLLPPQPPSQHQQLTSANLAATFPTLLQTPNTGNVLGSSGGGVVGYRNPMLFPGSTTGGVPGAFPILSAVSPCVSAAGDSDSHKSPLFGVFPQTTTSAMLVSTKTGAEANAVAKGKNASGVQAASKSVANKTKPTSKQLVQSQPSTGGGRTTTTATGTLRSAAQAPAADAPIININQEHQGRRGGQSCQQQHVHGPRSSCATTTTSVVTGERYSPRGKLQKSMKSTPSTTSRGPPAMASHQAKVTTTYGGKKEQIATASSLLEPFPNQPYCYSIGGSRFTLHHDNHHEQRQPAFRFEFRSDYAASDLLPEEQQQHASAPAVETPGALLSVPFPGNSTDTVAVKMPSTTAETAQTTSTSSSSPAKQFIQAGNTPAGSFNDHSADEEQKITSQPPQFVMNSSTIPGEVDVPPSRAAISSSNTVKNIITNRHVVPFSERDVGSQLYVRNLGLVHTATTRDGSPLLRSREGSPHSYQHHALLRHHAPVVSSRSKVLDVAAASPGVRSPSPVNHGGAVVRRAILGDGTKTAENQHAEAHLLTPRTGPPAVPCPSPKPIRTQASRFSPRCRSRSRGGAAGRDSPARRELQGGG